MTIEAEAGWVVLDHEDEDVYESVADLERLEAELEPDDGAAAEAPLVDDWEWEEDGEALEDLHEGEAPAPRERALPEDLHDRIEVELGLVEEFLEGRYGIGSAAGESVVFPSGVSLPVVAGEIAHESEHPDPAGSGNPLLDTGAANRSLRLSADFTAEELARSGATTFDRARIDPELVRGLQALRDRIGRPLQVTSGYRPEPFNTQRYDDHGLAAVASAHCSGQAADVRADGMTGAELARAAVEACGREVGVSAGPGFIHLDVGRALVQPDGELTEDAQLPPSPPTSPGSGLGPWVLLVAGFDCNFGGVSFARFARNRMKRVIAAYRAAHLGPSSAATLVATAPRFMLFDVGSGSVTKVTASGPTLTYHPVEVERFTAVTRAENYTSTEFRRNAAGRMSITDVYRHVRAIGASEHGTLRELSFFSHGVLESIVLVNSFDRQPAVAARDPDDKDGRAHKDFAPPNMSAAELAEFRAAFAADGFSWVFGCAFDESARQVLHQILRSPRFRRTRTGGLVDGDELPFRFSRSQAEKFFAIDGVFFPGRGSGGLHPLQFRRTLAQVKTFLRGRMDGSSARSLARTSGVHCFGALPGTYADYQKGGQLPLMLVPTSHPPYDDNFTRSIQFYTTYLGIVLDPLGHNYGRFEP